MGSGQLAQWKGTTTVHRVVRGGLPEKGTLAQSPTEVRKMVTCVKFGGNVFQIEGTDMQCNGSKSQICLVNLRTANKRVRLATERRKESEAENLVKEPKIIQSEVMFTSQLHLKKGKGKGKFSGTSRHLNEVCKQSLLMLQIRENDKD